MLFDFGLRRYLTTCLMLVGCVLAAPDDPSDIAIGVWKLNVKKSELPATGNPIASELHAISKVGPRTYRETFDVIYRDGQKRHNEVIRSYDGQERSVEGRVGHTERCELVSEFTAKCTMRQDGRITAELVGTISADHNTMTVRFKRVDPEGKAVTGVRIYEK